VLGVKDACPGPSGGQGEPNHAPPPGRTARKLYPAQSFTVGNLRWLGGVGEEQVSQAAINFVKPLGQAGPVGRITSVSLTDIPGVERYNRLIQLGSVVRILLAIT